MTTNYDRAIDTAIAIISQSFIDNPDGASIPGIAANVTRVFAAENLLMPDLPSPHPENEYESEWLPGHPTLSVSRYRGSDIWISDKDSEPGLTISITVNSQSDARALALALLAAADDIGSDES